MQIHCTPNLDDPPSTNVIKYLRALSEAVDREHTLDGWVQVVITDDEAMRKLNASYRGKNCPTDVLSFSMSEGIPLIAEEEVAAEMPVGEIYISLQRTDEQAREQDISRSKELARLMVHGLLHLVGYDHDTEAGFRFMESETDRLLGTVPMAASAERCSS